MADSRVMACTGLLLAALSVPAVAMGFMEDSRGAEEAFGAFMGCLTRGDYPAAYGMLADATRSAVSVDEFVRWRTPATLQIMGGVPFVRLRGSHREMGVQYGTLLADKMRLALAEMKPLLEPLGKTVHSVVMDAASGVLYFANGASYAAFADWYRYDWSADTWSLYRPAGKPGTFL